MGAEIDEVAQVPRVVRVKPGGPAALAGFLDGDVIVSVDGVSVTELSPGGVQIVLVNRPPGSKVKVGVTRGAKTVTGEITLREAPL